MFYRENGQFKTSYRADQAILPIRLDRIALMALLGFAVFIVPLLATPYVYTGLLIPFLILALATIGLNFLTGYCGQVSLGTGAFMSVGAYAAFNLVLRVPEMNLLLAFAFGGGVAALVGVVFGLPSLRIKGFYLAVATLAAQFFIDWVFIRIKWFTDGAPNATAPDLYLFGIHINTPMSRYLLVLGIVCVLALVAKNLVRGNIGRQWMAVRDMDIAAEIIGIRLLRTKLLAFAVSSFYCGVAGALWGFVHLGAWEPLTFDVNRSFQVLFMVIIGGVGSILGSFLGAAFIFALPILINQVPAALGVPVSTALASHLEAMIFGTLIIFFLIKEPHGFARLWALGKEKMRLWPLPH
ncbi:MAG: branched-chain amino acid ABC transporter permease [Acetobacteraceae bacterium]|nr:branched-chain amino acid ABC transporter permease [Acetobacteraceae bacterium]